MDRSRDLLAKAFELAYFIHQDRHLAKQIVIEAMDRRKTASTQQAKRRSYRLLGRGRLRRRRRDKVILEQASLLQYLIYRESELRELEQERQPGGAGLTDEDRIVRFIEHLVRITLPRNAFHVCIAIGRLLYRYSTAEVTKLYDVLIQDVERFPGLDYVRARKRILMDEVIDRFGSELRVQTGTHREKLFETRPVSERLIQSVQEALRMFTPWSTPCLLPHDFDPSLHELPVLRDQALNPDREHVQELQRMHIILHSPCFAGVISALGLDSPEHKLAVPIFFTDSDPDGDENGGSDPSPRDRFPSPLVEPELEKMENELRIRDERRAMWRLGELSIVIDGSEAGKIALPGTNRGRFDLPAEAAMVEIHGEHDHQPVRLATFLPAWSAADIRTSSTGQTAFEAEIGLDQGQVITFVTTPPAPQTGVGTLEAHYRETQPLRALAFAWQRWQASRRNSGRDRKRRFFPALASAGALTLAIAVGLFVLPSPPAPHGPRPINERPRELETSSVPIDTSNEGLAPTGRPDFPLQDPVRGSTNARAALPISEIEMIHIQTFGAASPLRALHQQLVLHLSQGNRFEIAEEPGQADAVLRLSRQDEASTVVGETNEPPAEPTRIKLVLVNRGGEILWQEELHLAAGDGDEARALRVVESLIASARQSP